MSHCFSDVEVNYRVAQTQYTVTSRCTTEPHPLMMLAVVRGKTDFQAERTVIISCFSIQCKFVQCLSDANENTFKL